MAKTLTEAKIAGRAERKRLAAGTHWRGLDPDVHLGYRRGKRGGAWVVRWYLGRGYRQQTLGTADDELHEGTLDYNAAVRSAREVVETERRKAREASAGPTLTVRKAVEAYIAARDARDTGRKGRPARSDASSRLSRYVIGKAPAGKRKEVSAAALSEVALANLSESELLKWRAALPAELKSATKQRLVNDLKAALNEAYATHRARLPVELPGVVKHGLRANRDESDNADDVARENQILSDAEVTRLIGAAREVDAEQGWDGDVYRLILVLAATGARFSQVARLRVRDVQPDKARLMIPSSRKGKGTKDAIKPVPIGPDVLEALLPAVADRKRDDPLLERWHSRQAAGGIQWQRVGRGPWKSASEINRVWAAIRKRTGMLKVIPYAFRHSSIVRGIRANLPIRLVAAMHDTSVAMIERHYGRHIADGLDELAARSVVRLVPNSTSRVVRLAR